MSNAIQFLEMLGRHPALIHAPAAAYENAVAALEIDDRQRSALMDRNHAALGELIRGRTKMMCIICTPDENEQEAVPDENDNDGDGVPDEDSSPTRE